MVVLSQADLMRMLGKSASSTKSAAGSDSSNTKSASSTSTAAEDGSGVAL